MSAERISYYTGGAASVRTMMADSDITRWLVLIVRRAWQRVHLTRLKTEEFLLLLCFVLKSRGVREPCHWLRKRVMGVRTMLAERSSSMA